MSGTWSGFSAEDIKKLTNQNSGDKVTFVVPSPCFSPITKPRKEKYFQNSRAKNKTLIVSNDILENAKLSTEKPKTSKSKMNANKTEETKENIETNNSTPSVQVEVEKEIKLVEKESKIEATNEITAEDITKKKLEDFEMKQKLIKEQNQKRKELLSKALEDRTRKTSEEVKKLKEIKEEFKKLDNLLSNDVSLLRVEIEVACVEFMEAQKKYDKLEKEYLDAKLTLHNKKERKEMLTEHLYTIIEKNEERKANKLSELMSRLEADKIKPIENIEEINNDNHQSATQLDKSESLAQTNK